MTPIERVADLRARGITLTVVRGRLRVFPASALRREDHAWLAGHWREVVDLLSSPVARSGLDQSVGPATADVPVWTVLASTDPAAVGGKWYGNRWCPPPRGTGPG
jgi:hypothetical protein